MGMYLSQQLGPFIKVKINKTEHKSQYQTCPNTSCSNNKKVMNSAFCSKCGTASASQDKTEMKDVISLGDFLADDMGEKFYEAHGLRDNKTNTTILVPNYSNPNGLKIDSSGGVIDIASNQKDNDLAWLNTTFSNEIEKLQNAVGKENVSIHWGIVSFYS